MIEPLPELPEEIVAARKQARRLEWWSIAALISIVIVMGLAMGSSQAMRTAWIEDMLSLLPPIVFLVADRIERYGATEKYPYGLSRANTLAFFASACALTAMGGFLIYDAVIALVTAEHPTIGSVSILGREVWLGWLMIAALCYSVVLPVILGRLKKPCARKLNDEVLHTDALMNAADWQTGVAGIVGIVGVAFGLWWADAAAAGLIAFSIMHDGVKALVGAMAELLDGAPRKLGSLEIDPVARRITKRLHEEYGDVVVQIRQTGRFIRASVEPRQAPHLEGWRAEQLAGKDEGWRLVEVNIAEREDIRQGHSEKDGKA